MKRQSLEDLISQTDAAKLRGVTAAAISDLIRRGRLSTVVIGGRKFVNRVEVSNFEELPSGRPKKERGKSSAVKKTAKS
jgi:hypothetical protein